MHSKSKDECNGVIISGEIDGHRSCGIRLGQWVLTSGFILHLHDKSNNHNENSRDYTNESTSLLSAFNSMKGTNFKVTHRNFSTDENQSAVPSEDISYSAAELSNFFFSKLVYKNLKNNFNNWKIIYSKYSTTLMLKLLSTLVLLKINDHENGSEFDIIKSFLRLSNSNRNIYRGTEIIVESTPFTLKAFLNSWSTGIISNIFGDDNCLFLTDARLVVGCEGAPLYKNNNGDKGNLIGMVIAPMLCYHGEWAGFTLAVHLQTMLNDILKLPTVGIPLELVEKEQPIQSNLLNNIDKSVVLVKSRGAWGSGIVVNARLGVIITCAHVVNHEKGRTLTVQSKNYNQTGKVVYCSKQGLAYDMAVIHTKPTPELRELNIAKDPPVEGEVVFCVGFPLVSSGNVTVSKGAVAKVVPNVLIQTTCCVQSGSSGGAIVRPNGQLLAMPVSNFSCAETNALFPHCNLAIPATVFDKPIKRYCSTYNTECLLNLTSSDPFTQMKWNFDETCKL